MPGNSPEDAANESAEGPRRPGQSGLEVSRAQRGKLRTWSGATRRFEKYLDVFPRATFWLLLSFVLLHITTGGAEVVWRKAPVWYGILGPRSSQVLRAFGGRDTRRVEQGEIWRFLSSGFLHGDLVHIFFNGL